MEQKVFSNDKFVQYVTDLIKDVNATFDIKANINPEEFCNSVTELMVDDMTSTEIMDLVMDTAYHKSTYEPDFEYLARLIAWKELHKTLPLDPIKTFELLYRNKEKYSKEHDPVIKKEVWDFIKRNEDSIRKAVDYTRDYKLSYFAYSTLIKSYFQKIDNKVVETAQDMWIRVAVGIHYKANDIEAALRTYESLSLGYYTHATPTLFNAGTPKAQNSSCFLLNIPDSLDKIYEVLKECALISKNSGGIGLNCSGVRAKNTIIKGTRGHSNGIIPMIKVYNETARYCDQGGCKRKGSFAFYLEPWHAEIFEFLELRLNNGPPELRARDIFIGLWINDLFMERVKNDGMWSLFCPYKVGKKYGKNLQDVYGKEFEELYIQAEQDKMYNKQVRAQNLYRHMIVSQLLCSQPYVMYKDHVNHKNNQSNIGIIRGSNLCTEIVEYTDEDHISVCNLASLSLPSFVKVNKDGKKYVDFELLGEKTEELVVNLNRVIEVNEYPVEKAKTTNIKHRPIGIGVQGLADLFAIMEYAWDSKEAELLNKYLAETIYYYATRKSALLGISEGSYEYFKGSPISKGILQPDMWHVKPITKYSWDELRMLCKRGMRNSLLISPMPTASTAHILGNNESTEMFTNLVYSRKVIAGEYMVVNKHLVDCLKKLKLWSTDIVDQIVSDEGSIQNIKCIPDNIKSIFRTVWEMSQKVVINLTADRCAFVDQSNSLNIFIKHPTIAQLSSLHMYTWTKGLKTGMYYLRSQPSRNANQLTLMNKVSELEDDKKSESGLTSKLSKLSISQDDVIEPSYGEKSGIKLKKNEKANKTFLCVDDVCIMCSG